MRFGLHLDNDRTNSPRDAISAWRKSVAIADTTGFDYISVVDHLVPFPSFRPKQIPLFDPWQLLADFAAQTCNVTLLTLVSNGSIAHPVRLAKQVATLDVLSDGRMMLGLGAGGYEADEAAIGMPIRTQSERLARLSECIDVLSTLWNGGDTSANGRFYPLDGYTSSPSPVSSPKLLIAGKSRQILRLAAHKASACNFAFTEIGALDALIKRLQTDLLAAGRNLQTFEVTLLDRVFVGASDEVAEQAWRAAGAPTVLGHRGLIGGVAKVVRDLKFLQKTGVNTIFCMFQNPESVSRFAHEVLPQLQQHQV